VADTALQEATMAEAYRPWTWPDFVRFKSELAETMEVLRDPGWRGHRVRAGVVYQRFLTENRSSTSLVRAAWLTKTNDNEQHRILGLFNLYWALRTYGDDRAILKGGLLRAVLLYAAQSRHLRRI